MKKIISILLLFVFVLICASGFAQSKRAEALKMASGASTFSTNVPVGTIVLDQALNVLYEITVASASGTTLTAATKDEIGPADGNGIYTGNGAVPDNTDAALGGDLTFGSDLLYLNETSGIVGIGTSTSSARLHVKGEGITGATTAFSVENLAGTKMFNIKDNGHIGQNALADPPIQYYLHGNGSAYGFYVDGTNASHYTSVGGAINGGFGVSGVKAGSKGVNVIASGDVTGGRVGGNFHMFGNNTAGNTGVSIRAENGVENLALDIISGDILMKSGLSYLSTSTATQKGSDGGIKLASALWDGVGNTYNEFEIKAEASVTVNELTNLNMSYNGANALSITSDLNIGIGTETPHASALIDVESTTQGIGTPNMTTAQMNAITAPKGGLIIFDDDINKTAEYDGANWHYLRSTARGQSYVTSATETIISTVNTPVKILGTTTVEILDEVDSDGGTNNRLRYTGSETKVFRVNGSASLITAGNNKDITIYIYKYDDSAASGSVCAASASQNKIQTGSDTEVFPFSCLVELDENDYIEVWIENNTDAVNVTANLMHYSIK